MRYFDHYPVQYTSCLQFLIEELLRSPVSQHGHGHPLITWQCQSYYTYACAFVFRLQYSATVHMFSQKFQKLMTFDLLCFGRAPHVLSILAAHCSCHVPNSILLLLFQGI